jgi:hypothetical protein
VHEERVAIWIRASDCLRANHPTRATPIVDHDRYAKLRAKPLGDNTSQDIGNPAGRLRHDDGHLLDGDG